MIRSFYHSNRLCTFDKKNVVYLAYVGKIKNVDTFKYGKSSDVYAREYLAHRKVFKTFEMVNIFETNYKDHVEKMFAKELKIRNIHKNITISRKRHTELFITTDIYTLPTIETLLKSIVDDFDANDHNKMQLEMEKIQLEKLKIELQLQKISLSNK